MTAAVKVLLAKVYIPKERCGKLIIFRALLLSLFFLEEGKKYGVFVSTRSCFALSSINPGYVHSIRKIALTENGPMILFYPQCLKMTKNVSYYI